MLPSLNLAAPPVYDALIGVGGIGSGSFFELTGNHTLGREESRGGRYLDRRDYCKLHIIVHGSPETVVRDVRFDDVRTEIRSGEPFVFRHCQGVQLNNVEASVEAGAPSEVPA